jgi:hypothetical protein
MNLYVLDTDTLHLYQDGHPEVVGRVRAVAAGARAISVVTVEGRDRGRSSRRNRDAPPIPLPLLAVGADQRRRPTLGQRVKTRV